MEYISITTITLIVFVTVVFVTVIRFVHFAYTAEHCLTTCMNQTMIEYDKKITKMTILILKVVPVINVNTMVAAAIVAFILAYSERRMEIQPQWSSVYF